MNPKRAAASALLFVMLIVMVPVGFFAASTESAEATEEIVEPSQSAQPVDPSLVSCGPEEGNVVCRLLDGTIIATVPIPVIEIPGPSIPGPTVKVTLPPVTVTAPPIRLPGPTVTVTAPGETVTAPPAPPRTLTETVTETVRVPGPTATVVAPPFPPRPAETVTATATVTAEPTGQPTTPSATVEPSPEPRTVTETETRTKTETIVRNVLFGALATLVLVGLGILALWLGYILGYKGAERNEERSLRGMLDVLKSER